MFWKIFFAVVGGILGLIVAVAAGIALVDLARFARFWLSSRRLDEAPYEDDLQKLFEKKQTPEEEAAAQGEVWSRFYGPGLSRRKLAAFRRLIDGPNTFLLGDAAFSLWWRSWRRLALEASSADLRREALALAEREGRARLVQLSSADLDLLLALPIEGKEGLELTWALNNTDHRLRRGEARRRLEALAERDTVDGRAALSKAIEEALESGEEDHALRLWERLRREDSYTRGDVEQRLRRHFAPEVEVIASVGTLRVARLRRASGAELRLWPLRFVADEHQARQWLRQPPPPGSGLRGEGLEPRPLALLSLPFDAALVAFRMPRLRGTFAAEIAARPAPSRLYARCMGGGDLSEDTASETLQGARLDAVLTLTEEGASLWVVDLDTRAPAADLPVTFWFYRGEGGELASSQARTDRDGLASLRGVRFWQLGASVQRAGDHGADEFLFLTHGQDISTAPRHAGEEDRLYFWLARPLYRPGEALQGKLIARKKGASKPSFRWQEARAITVDVRGPRGNTLATLDLRLSRFGSASFSVPIPADAPLGRYTFAPRNLPEGSVEGGFFVEEFVAPEFRASLRAEGAPRWGEPASLAFEASYFFGGPVAEAEGTVEVRRACWSHLASQSWPPLRVHSDEVVLPPLRFRTDAAGRASIELPWQGPLDLLRRYDGCDLRLKATVRDASGKTCEATMTLSQGRIAHAVKVDPEQSLRLPGEPVELSLQWHPPPGKTLSFTT